MELALRVVLAVGLAGFAGTATGADNSPGNGAKTSASIASPPKERYGDKDIRTHWAYQPMVDHAPPSVRDPHWPRTPIDRFILARLEEMQLKPVGAADKRTLIRRATFDLIGLPPTRPEIGDFLEDDSTEAFARVIDRLLASPRYGERWGRHWLDVVRYADSNGLDENIGFPHAFRYRDYVIEAFNKDKPYDVFVTEQLAGDLMTGPANNEERFERLTATGFLAVGAKVLAEQDKEKMVMDIIDEQLDVLGKAFMGQTLGCARCHDHKFDPIPASDYYAMAGIFKSTATLGAERELADQATIEAKREHGRRLAKTEEELEALNEEARNLVQGKWQAIWPSTCLLQRNRKESL